MLALYTETLETLLKNKHYGEVSQDTSLTEVKNLMDKFPAFVFDDIHLDMWDLFVQKYDIREIGAETEEMFIHFWREKTNELLMKYAPKMQKWLENFDDLFKFTVQLKKKITREEDISGSDSNTETRNLSKSSDDTETRNLAKTNDTTETNNTTDTTTTNNKETYYLNPVSNVSPANLKVDNVTENNGTETLAKTGTVRNAGTENDTGTVRNAGTETDTGTIGNSGTNSESRDFEENETRDVLQSVWGKTRADIMEKILNLKDIFNDCLVEYEVIFMGVY